MEGVTSPSRDSHLSHWRKRPIILEREASDSAEVGRLMYIRTENLRRIVSCLAIVSTLVGGLQESRAFCYWTACKCAGSETSVTKCHCCHKTEAKKGGEADNHPAVHAKRCVAESGVHHQQIPCQKGCWCCSPANPVLISQDGTANVNDRVAAAIIASVEQFASDGAEIFEQSTDITIHLSADALSAAQFCVQLCRFQI